jgi:hypothetical protein
MYDNTLFFRDYVRDHVDIVESLGLKRGDFILATIHRNNNTDDPVRLSNIFKALLELTENQGQTVLLPLHPRTKKVLDRPHTLHPADMLQAVLSAAEVVALQIHVDQVHMDESLSEYLLAIVQATRQSELLSLGVSTRGALALSKTAKALALVRGRDYCLPDDIKELAPIVLSHRVMLNRTHGMRTQSFEQAERIILDIVDTVPVPV